MGRCIYLDDERKPPPGFVLVRTAEECIEAIKAGDVDEVSLDHDLGVGYSTGYAVVAWMAEHNVWPAEITLHTMNPEGRRAMAALIRNHAPATTRVVSSPGWSGGPMPSNTEEQKP